ncbi:acyl-CoA dehydratase activase [Caloranaerobacter azorensis]|uniref:CoA-substrate-specific enzyme activase, putative n=3 Tax=Caloranaerobacter azorensis TaxID=116090 RepID=A0A1M5S0L9_9FIRM|nr:acyl-CoA dehydratase activase [Caloranaerobacter azorensis]KGG80478.1 2-hydroxyglutaryl-CoA dehydratase [Caloranaerobacter azorensis H53214]QIB27333.1 2-hydroxyglutaryl-CoA dehydratase [Caloranaerobacter azorensis]SHH31888.1 CoA-substrate-specific enzyme activase, putative [Caloranaerobacter azorensis DSM 13643]
MVKAYIGIDVGSVSTNIIALDEDNEVLFKLYERTNGQPLETIKKGLKKLRDELGKNIIVSGVGTTGSGRQLAGVMIGADIIKNEITAHAVATVHYVPDVRTIFEIGGQDSKIILIKDQMVVDFAMNTVCAAGTGSFLDHQAERLGIPIEEFGKLALTSKNDVRIAGRCTVFAESDMIAKQQYGFSKADIIKGLCNALVRNYINNLGRGKKLEPPYVFQGGVAANIGIKAAFEREVGHEVIVPKYYNVMGAIGAALLAKEAVKEKGKTNFRGFDSLKTNFVPSSFICTGCSNMCEVIKVEMDGTPIAMWGDRCGMWTEKVKQAM